MIETLADAALQYYSAGLHVIPLKPRDKRPIDGRSWKDELGTFQLQSMWRDHPDLNVGMATGRASGIIVVDPDSREAMGWVREHLPPTPWVVKTGKGEHWGYKAVGEFPNVTAWGCRKPKSDDHAGCVAGGALCKLDIRGDAGYVVAPPSIHPSGATYAWTNGSMPDPATLPAFDPKWFPARPVAPVEVKSEVKSVDLDANVKRARAWLEKRDGAVFGSGTGDQHYIATAMKVCVDFGLGDGADAFNLMSEWNQRCAPPQDDRFIKQKIRSAVRSGQNAVGSIEDRELVKVERPDNTAWAENRRGRLVELKNDDPLAERERKFQRASDWEIDRFEVKVDWPVKRIKKEVTGELIQIPKKSAIENTHALLCRYGITVQYNMMTHRIELLGVPGQTDQSPLENFELVGLSFVTALCDRYDLGKKETTLNFLIQLAARRCYHPVYDWATSKPWDGQTRLAQVMGAFKLAKHQDAQLAELLVFRWLVSVAAAMAPKNWNEFKSQGVLTLQGPQNSRKTTFFETLVPKHLRAVRCGLVLDLKSKDSVIAAISSLFVELGEVDATFNKSENAHMKAFLTQEADTVRFPYMMTDQTIPRRTVYAATVNPISFLQDMTGNRRWWVISVEQMTPLPELGIDLQQLWAELLYMVEEGAIWYLMPEEVKWLEQANLRFRPEALHVSELWDNWSDVADADARVPLTEILAGMPTYANGRRLNPKEQRDIQEALRMSGVLCDTKTDGRVVYRVKYIGKSFERSTSAVWEPRSRRESTRYGD